MHVKDELSKFNGFLKFCYDEVMMYREFHSKLFGKRELNWHISVGTYKTNEVIHSHTIIHVFDNARQNTTSSNAILKDCVDRLNAGCFHSVEGISK